MIKQGDFHILSSSNSFLETTGAKQWECQWLHENNHRCQRAWII